MNPREWAKAIAAFCGTAVSTITASALDDGLTGTDMLVVWLGAIGAAALVFAVPNKPPADVADQEQE